MLGNFGVALLLFIVGLGLNPKVIKAVGKVAVLTGVGQVLFTTFFGFWIATSLGYSQTTALFIAVGLAFSSTIIILKLLSDKKEQNQLYGKISIGFLLVQDIIATFALVVVSAMAMDHSATMTSYRYWAKAQHCLLGVFFLAHFVIRPMTNFLSNLKNCYILLL